LDKDSESDGEFESKLEKYVKKLKSLMEEEADEVFEMFELLDSGGEVNIGELENEKVKIYLIKIFKYLGLNKNAETKEYKKPVGFTEPIKK